MISGAMSLAQNPPFHVIVSNVAGACSVFGSEHDRFKVVGTEVAYASSGCEHRFVHPRLAIVARLSIFFCASDDDDYFCPAYMWEACNGTCLRNSDAP